VRVNDGGSRVNEQSSSQAISRDEYTRWALHQTAGSVFGRQSERALLKGQNADQLHARFEVRFMIHRVLEVKWPPEDPSRIGSRRHMISRCVRIHGYSS